MNAVSYQYEINLIMNPGIKEMLIEDLNVIQNYTAVLPRHFKHQGYIDISIEYDFLFLYVLS